jgi:acyl carrier protein
MANATTEKLQEVFRAVFELPPTADVTHLDQTTQSNWDSLGHVNLVAALESEFNISLDTADTLRIHSFETALQLLEERGIVSSPQG